MKILNMDTLMVKWRRYQWLHLTSVDEERVEWLKDEFNFYDLDLEDCTSEKILRPKWEKHDDHSFFVFNFATLDRNDRIQIQELKVFIGKNYLVTVSKDDMPVTKWFEDELQVEEKELAVGSPGAVMHRLVDRLTDRGLLTVRKLGVMLDGLDTRMSNLDKKAIAEGSKIRRNLILYTTTLKPMIRIMQKLEGTKTSYLNGKLSDYWGNIADHLNQIYDTVVDYTELLEGLTVSFDALLTQKTNETVRVLTVFSVLFLPLTLISGVYGMNVGLPGANNQSAFVMIMALMGAILLVMLGVFKLKKWV